MLLGAHAKALTELTSERIGSETFSRIVVIGDGRITDCAGSKGRPHKGAPALLTAGEDGCKDRVRPVVPCGFDEHEARGCRQATYVDEWALAEPASGLEFASGSGMVVGLCGRRPRHGVHGARKRLGRAELRARSPACEGASAR